jgi:hypothetical protein
MALPKMAVSVENIIAKQDAVDTVSFLIERNQELEEIYETLQPLLYALSVKLYEEGTPVSLSNIVADSIKFINEE